MPEESNIVAKASEYVFRLFQERLPDHLPFHTFDHTKSVAETARKIGKGMKLGEEGIEVVTLAGWLHDVGYTEIYKGHEEVSVRIATEFLMQEDYPAEKIALIAGCIRATKIPQSPQNLLEEIVADADLSGFGRKSFFEQSELIHNEWEKALGKSYSEEEWAQQNLELLATHKYFTSYAQKSFSEQQAANIHTLYKKLRKLQKMKEEDLQSNTFEKSFAGPAENIPLPDHSTEMMFNLISLNHMTLSSMADHKAQNMIFSNATIISLVVSFVVKGFFDHLNLNFAIPVFMLLTASLFAIIFAVLAIRPKISSGISRWEDIANRKANLLFFGNFYKMPYDDFSEGIKEMIEDKDYLQNSLIKDCYYLGKTVGKKYQYLYWSYNIFIYGLCLTILAFLFFLLFPIKP